MKTFMEFLKEGAPEYQQIGDRKFRRKDGTWAELVPADEHGELPPATVELSPEEAKELGLG